MPTDRYVCLKCAGYVESRRDLKEIESHIENHGIADPIEDRDYMQKIPNLNKSENGSFLINNTIYAVRVLHGYLIEPISEELYKW